MVKTHTIKSLSLQKCSVLFFIIACFTSYSAFAQATISGYISAAETGESLVFASVLEKNEGLGTSANQFGFYSMTLKPGPVTLRYSYVGHASKEFSFELAKDTAINISLASDGLLEEVIVKGEESKVESSRMSTNKVEIAQIKALPALMGEVDVMKILQLLPGVQSGSEGNSGLYVRGGGPDQNLILLDGVPVYNASHLFGFFSVFNADAINHVELIKGGFPARYGGRLSSVIDIQMKEGNNQKFGGSGSIGLISSKLTLEGPIKSEKTSFIVSGRRTYIDILARPLIKKESGGDSDGGYFFYDLNAKVNHRFSDRDRVYVSAYLGSDKAFARDKYSYDDGNVKVTGNDEFGLRWGNITSALRWNHIFSQKVFANTTLTFSKYKFDIFEELKERVEVVGGTFQNDNQTAQYYSGITDQAAKIDFDYIPNPNHFVRFGVGATRHLYEPGVLAFQSTTESDTTLKAGNTRSTELALYVEDDWKINNKFKVNLGIHASGFAVENTFYQSIQPRISARYMVADELSLKASFAQMTQFIHLLSNTSIGLPTDLWVPATKKIKPQESWQVSAGIEKGFNGKYGITVEGYYKEMDNLIEYEEGASFFSLNETWENKVAVGRGKSYGAEFFLEKKTGKVTGWLGYTWSNTTRQFDNLNFGKWFPYRYDRRNDISLAAVFAKSEKMTISGTWVYGTGNAISLPAGNYQRKLELPWDENNTVQQYTGRNDFRMEPYHRLDLSVAFTKVKKNGNRVWSFGVYNAYNRRNPFFIDLSYDTQGRRKFIKYSLFQVIPSVTYHFEFGK